MCLAIPCGTHSLTQHGPAVPCGTEYVSFLLHSHLVVEYVFAELKIFSFA